MENQHTVNTYSDNEINKIMLLYTSGMSFSRIGLTLNRKKRNIKKILIEQGLYIEDRDNVKKEFSNVDIDEIIRLYCVENLSTKKIGKMFNASVNPIKRVLNVHNLLRKGYSDGVKINLTDEQQERIKELYLNEYLTTKEIGCRVGLTESFISKYLNSSGYRRTKNEGASIGLVKRFSGVGYDEYLKNLSEYKKYRRKVISITNKQPIHSLSNYDKRGMSGIDGAFHLDHKFSINEGFKNKIRPELIGNLNNLEFISWEENVMKRTKCSITKEELIKNK